MRKRIMIACLLASAQTGVWAKVVLPDIISDNMVLQQQTEVCLWGKANPNTEVTVRVSWNDQTYTVASDNAGRWLAKVQTPAATYEAQSITFSDGEETSVENVLIGEVWFCSGQSNMEMPLSGFWNCPIEGANETIATASKWKGIRVATIEKNGQLEPVDVCYGSWKVSNPENAPSFSATAFHFAMMMNQVLDIPVGIINCSWGGTRVEGWLPESIVRNYPDIDLKRDIRKEEPHDWWHYLSPILMYNGMLKPLENYTIKGFLWYQGESNVGRPDYAERLKTMVDLWRNEWGLGELPFYYVEIAPFGSYENTGSAFLREQQFKAQSIIPNSGMISTNDLVEPYEANNVHPKDKTDVGKRLAYLALARTYGVKGIAAVGPSYKSMEIREDGSVILSFNNAEDGFNRQDGMEGFEVAGSDRVFYPAKAEVYNNLQIKVTCDKVTDPVAVRYCFRDFQPGNVAGTRELPLYPFRTDDW